MTPLAAEPFTKYLVIDILRIAIASAALVLCTLIARLAVHRHRRRYTDPVAYAEQTHPFTMWSYAVLLFFMAVRRADTLGEPWSWYLAPSVVSLALGYVGVTRRVTFTLAPPWRRPPR